VIGQRFGTHFTRLMHQCGWPITVQSRSYRLAGYYPNRITHDPQHELWMSEILGRALQNRGGAFVDVGVNTGQTLMKVLSIDPLRQYIGFEPQIGCCFFVEQFIRENGLQNATLVPVALSDENRLCTLYSNSPYDSAASIAESRGANGRERRIASIVPARVGDEVIEEVGLGEIAVVKIDVEGAELQVVSGLRKTLEAKRPVLIFEVLPNFFGVHERAMKEEEICRHHAQNAESLYKAIWGAGYKISQIHERTGAEIQADHFNMTDINGFVGSNYVAWPQT
jgi:FkbM family methyltransferase